MQILTFYERERIEYYKRLKLGVRDIGRRLIRDPSLISRELKRNIDRKGKYSAVAAQRKADFKSHKTNKRKLETNWQLHDWVENKLKLGWSPELIAGRLKSKPPPELRKVRVSHEQIYQYIYEGRGRWEGWYHYLHRKRPFRQKRHIRQKQAKTLIKERIPIELRPEMINERLRVGDWESDLALFKKQTQALSVQYERKMMLIRFHRVQNKSALENEQAIIKTIDELPQEFSKSITFDNGSENTCHAKLRDNFNLKTFFCHTYSAWQKGGVENSIGLIRRYLPRSTNLATINDETLHLIQERLNNRPRKKLNYLTPNEALSVALNS